MTEYTVRLPTPHKIQARFLGSKAKRKVIVAGRRGGKTTGAAMLAAEAAMEGKRVLEAAPTADQTGAFWDNVTDYFADPIAKGKIYKHETKRLLELPNKGAIRCKTAYNADTLRGDYADLLILDEFQLMKPDAWDKVGAPMMLDNNGDAVFIGTPLRRNHFFVQYNKAVADRSGRSKAWKFTSIENPYLSKEALEEITEDMTDESYRQEVLAEFLENEGVVFRNIKACMNAPLLDVYDNHPRHNIVGGIDWGKQNDFTVISIGCATCKQEVWRDRFNKIDYLFQLERLKIGYKMWRVRLILPERNAMEMAVEWLVRDGIRVATGPDAELGFMTTASTKPQLISNLALALENEEWQFQDDPIWTGEMEAYERIVSLVTGRSRYGAPEGMHDDTVIARALMVWAGRSDARIGEQPEQKSRFATEQEGSRWKGL